MAKGDDKTTAATNVANSQTARDLGQTGLETKIQGSNEGFQSNYNHGSGKNMMSYDEIMGGYRNLYQNPFGASGVNGSGGLGGGGGGQPGYGEQRGIYSDLANNGGGYGWDGLFRGAMDKSISGYGNFADTGGFSQGDLGNIRQRSISPVRAVYSNAERELNRSRSLGGASPNFAAAQARMAREMGHTTADAATNAEAGIAQMVQQGKLAGLSGLSQTGAAGQGLSTDIDSLNAQMKLAGLSGMMGVDDRLGAQASAAGARSDANAQDYYRAQMGALGGMSDLYGTTPGLLNTTGNQLLGSNQQLIDAQGQRGQNTAMDYQMYGPKAGYGQQKPGVNWGQVAGAAATAAPYIAMAASDKNLKEKIRPINERNVFSKLEKLPISKWNYKGDSTRHIGPMAQDFKKAFGTGDGKTIALVDVMGVMMTAAKAMGKKRKEARA